MSVNTSDRRASAVNIGLFWRGMLPRPAGQIGSVARVMVAAFYAGFAGTDVFPTGISATGATGAVTAVATYPIALTGVSVTGATGAVTITVSQQIVLTHVTMTGVIGNLLVWGPPTPVPPPGNWVPVPGAPGGGWASIVPPDTDWVPVVT